MFPKEIFTQLVSELGVYNLKITSFAYILILSYSILTGVDLDPEDSEIRIQYGSGSTTLILSTEDSSNCVEIRIPRPALQKNLIKM